VSTDLVRASPASVPATGNVASLPVLVERAGGAARFAWDEFFYAKHHNPHTQEAFMRAVRRFVDWVPGTGSGDTILNNLRELGLVSLEAVRPLCSAAGIVPEVGSIALCGLHAFFLPELAG
jgi:hypothetical protein